MLLPRGPEERSGGPGPSEGCCEVNVRGDSFCETLEEPLTNSGGLPSEITHLSPSCPSSSSLSTRVLVSEDTAQKFPQDLAPSSPRWSSPNHLSRGLQLSLLQRQPHSLQNSSIQIVTASFSLFSVCFWPHCEACGISSAVTRNQTCAPCSGSEESQSWSIREVPFSLIFKVFFFL